MDIHTWHIILASVFLILWLVNFFLDHSKEVDGLKHIYAKIQEKYGVIDSFVAPDHCSIAIDNTNQKIIFGREEEFSEYRYSDISNIEIIKNGNVLTSTNRGSQALGAAVGGLAFGGIGAVVGALTGTNTATNTLKKLSIRVIVNDPANPMHNIVFFNFDAGNGADPDGELAKPSVQLADRFYALLFNAMRQAESEKESTNQKAKSDNGGSAAEEIARLWDLHKQGVLTEAEFTNQKQKILSRS